MKIVLFDLGKTLESEVHGVLMPGVLVVLETISGMTDGDGQPIFMALCSDFKMPNPPGSNAQILSILQEYYSILDQLDIRRFFEPVDSRVTLSTEVGIFKPDPKVFRTALDKIDELTSTATTYTYLRVAVSLEYWGSDHAPFLDEGLTAVLTIEGADQANTNEHSARDTPGQINIDLAVEILFTNWMFTHWCRQNRKEGF